MRLKVDELNHLLIDSNLDFLALSETWLHNIATSVIDVPGYVCYRKDRSHGRGGGVLLYARNTFKCNEIKIDTSLECLAVNVVLSPKMNFNVVVLYNPPSHNVSFYHDLGELLKILNCHLETILLGDINVNWICKSGKQKLKMLMSKHNFKQMVKDPTRITRTSKTLIDLIFTNKPERITRTFNLITGLSDHNMTLVVRKLTKQRLPVFINENKTGSSFIPKNKMPQFENKLNNVDWTEVLQTNELESCCINLIKTLTDLINKFTKQFKKRQPRATLPWLNNDILQKKRSGTEKVTVHQT